jgi:dihydroflavonol-4-reductase
MRGARALFHADADYRLWAPDADEILRNNLTSIRTAMEETMRAAVERIVYTSSVATLVCTPTGKVADETVPMK